MRQIHFPVTVLGLLTLALPLQAASPAAVGIRPLLRVAGARAGNAAGAAAVALRLDDGATRLLHDQRGRFTAQAIPLADGSAEDFEVEHLEVFAANAEAYEFDGVQRRRIALPQVSLFAGKGINDPDKHLILSVVNGSEVWAMVRSSGTLSSLIGPTRHRRTAHSHDLIAGSLAAQAQRDRHLCGGVLAAGETPATAPRHNSTRATSDDLLAVEMLVDVGNDLYTTAFGSNSASAAAYIANLFGSVAAVYRRDLKVAPVLQTLVIWTTPESFASSNSVNQLVGYRQYNIENRGALPRDLAHYVDSRGSGGLAYLPGVCGIYGYGVSNIDGDAPFPVVGYEWDVNVIAHEMGHNLGAHHTHCYDPPVDRCWSQEPGCYRGSSLPQVGETMSYCHLVASVDIGFHGFIGNVIRSTAEAAPCVGLKTAVCGDAVIDSGEQCDDGNLLDGDCCSAACQLTGSEDAACEDGQYCTVDYSCPDTTCLSQPRLCDDGNLCTMDFCDEQANQCSSVSRDGASCDDGLYCTADDRCEAGVCTSPITPCADDNACTVESCDEDTQVCDHVVLPPSNSCRQAVVSHLTLKDTADPAKDALQWKWLKGAATAHADFLSPTSDTDYSLCLYDETDNLVLRADAPAAGQCGRKSCWREAANRGFTYKDRSGSANGTTGLALKPGIAGKSKIILKAKGVDLGAIALPLAPTSTLRAQLRNERDATCFASTFTAPFTKNQVGKFSDKE